ncbi:MAG: hypothetical protein P4M14_04625 [Gammaproteobacteria bacterium]|nr:hypothetical protein [Gammaproteobacteria bacterium]
MEANLAQISGTGLIGSASGLFSGQKAHVDYFKNRRAEYLNPDFQVATQTLATTALFSSLLD